LSSTRTLHLLLTDLTLPCLDGATLTARLRAHHPHLAVIMMSGYRKEYLVAEGRLDVAVPFLHKPFSPAALAHAVRTTLDAQTMDTAHPHHLVE
jgi:CheY-like chemotaxis protein